MSYKLQMRSGASATIAAARFESDGAGVRFYDETGAIIAAFADGQVASVVPADLVFEDPSPEAPA